MRKLIYFIVFSCAYLTANGQDCNCDHIITPTDRDIFAENDFKGKPILPGDTVCFETGVHEDYKYFINMHGTAEDPIVLINCGGQVIIRGNSPSHNGITTHKSSFFHITGTGDPSVKFGFRIENQLNGIILGNLSKNFEIDHVEIINAGSHGIDLKTDPSCDSLTWRENGFINDYVIVHDVHIDGTVDEGMYIGNSHYNTTVTRTCNGQEIQVGEHPILKVEVYNSLVENTGADGIQIGCAIEEGKVFNNVVRNFALNQATANTGHTSGIQANPGTKANFFNNIVMDGKGAAFFLAADGGKVYNNISKNTGNGTIVIERTITPDVSFEIFNNTFLNANGWAVYMLSNQSINNIFHNNIVHIDPLSSEAKYIVEHNGALFDKASNLFTKDIASLQFADYENDDFRLTEGSTDAINKGNCGGFSDFTTDYYGEDRIQQNQCDIGASEFTDITLYTDKEEQVKSEVLFYSNPTNDIIKLNTSVINGNFEVLVFNLNGKLLLISSTSEINLSHLLSGIYFVKVISEQAIYGERIVKL